MKFYHSYYFVDDYAVSFPELVQMYIEYTESEPDEDEEDYTPYSDFDEWLIEGMMVYITEELPDRIPRKYHLAAEIAGFIEEQVDFKHEDNKTFNERFLQIAYMIECEPRSVIDTLERYNSSWEAEDFIEELKRDYYRRW